jgi:metallo-beta-lactamase family protein
VLSHAHIDHSGRIPLLTRGGLSGRVICTRPTRDACEYLLPDSAHIQESDASYLNYKTLRSALSQMQSHQAGKNQLRKTLKKGGHRLDDETINQLITEHRLEKIEPLYTMEDAAAALAYLDGWPYHQAIEVGHETYCTFYEAGHILGSAVIVIRSKDRGHPKTVCFSGDLGRFQKPIIRDPNLDFAAEDRQIDLLIMESTYGDRTHAPAADMKQQLENAILGGVERGGAILIPSFAFGRTQELLYLAHQLYDEGKIPRLPVYVDSPLATRITRVFGEHPEAYDNETHRVFLENGKNPFAFPQLRFVATLEESMALNRDMTPHIVIAASGMCEAGRILHHLRHKIHHPETTILIVGFMAQHTLGRRILEQGLAYQQSGRRGDPPMLKFLNKQYPLAAHVEVLDGFSAHADRDEMLAFLRRSNLEVKRIAVVHGEEEQTMGFVDHLKKAGYNAFAPRFGESVRI